MDSRSDFRSWPGSRESGIRKLRRFAPIGTGRIDRTEWSLSVGIAGRFHWTTQFQLECGFITQHETQHKLFLHFLRNGKNA